jgi:hypothetical protein
MAMMKAGKFCIKDEPFNLKELISNIIEMFQLQANRKSIIID